MASPFAIPQIANITRLIERVSVPLNWKKETLYNCCEGDCWKGK